MSNGFNIDVIGEYVLELNEQGPPGVPGLSIESVTAISFDEETGTYTYRITYNDGSHFDFEIQSGKTYAFSTGLTNTDDTITVDFSEVATASQGAKADTAVQPSDLQSALADKLDVDPDGVNNLIENNKINIIYVPDILLGQMLYAGTFVPSTAVATLTTNAKTKLGTSDNTITLTNDTTDITGYEANEGNFYLASADGTFASIDFLVGDWLVSTGSGWIKIDNTDAVTGVKGNEESAYRIGNVNITADNVLPTQTNNNGKYLKTNGTTCSWENADALPSQTGNNGKFLTTNGTDLSWSDLPEYNKYLKNYGTGVNSMAIGASPTKTSASGISSLAIMGEACGGDDIAIGAGSTSKSDFGIAIGSDASIPSYCGDSIAIGREASVSKGSAIQIGTGVNRTELTLAIGFGGFDSHDLEYTLLDGITGKIPNARLDTDSVPTQNSTKPITSGAVYDTLGDIETLLQGV